MTVRLTRLDNGLRVVSHTMDAVETVSVGMFVGAGTRNEPPEINGVAHLLEHMAFKGTARRSALDIASEIEAVGGHLNAFTTREHTAYYAKVLKEDVGLAVDMLADILQYSTFDPSELARERSVILQEIGQAHDTPDDVIFDRLQSIAYPDQPLGRPVLGDAERVRNMPREAIIGYMNDAYGTGAMVLSAAGMIEHEHLVSLARTLFRDLPVRDPLRCETARYGGGHIREDRDLEQVHLTLGFPGVGLHDEDLFAASVMSTLFGGGMSSRLFQEIRERRGLVYSIHSYAAHYSDGGLFGIYAGTGEAEAAELVPVLCEEIVRLADSLEEEEIRRARNQLKASVLMSLESTGARAEQIGEQVLVYGAPLPVDEIVRRIEAVDSAAVERVARRVFAGQPSVAAIGPLRRIMPYEEMVDRLSA
ncbi:MAG TPA: insulinase family protein [Alphaproteobacteria bacterium]|nr:insulinase family protein [Alphaproteobacteria bacterium]